MEFAKMMSKMFKSVALCVMKMYYDFPKPPMIPRIAAAGTLFSPLPCQVWHGMRFTNAHHVEVEVGADGPANEPPPGRRRFAAGGRYVASNVLLQQCIVGLYTCTRG
jgi:hypothetical protein